MGKLADAYQQPVPDVPNGYLTARQWAKVEGYSLPHIHRILGGLLDDGKVVRDDFRISAGGGVRKVPHYKLK